MPGRGKASTSLTTSEPSSASDVAPARRGVVRLGPAMAGDSRATLLTVRGVRISPGQAPVGRSGARIAVEVRAGVRVKLPNGALSHQRADCGKWCPDCSHETYCPSGAFRVRRPTPTIRSTPKPAGSTAANAGRRSPAGTSCAKPGWRSTRCCAGRAVRRHAPTRQRSASTSRRRGRTRLAKACKRARAWSRWPASKRGARGAGGAYRQLGTRRLLPPAAPPYDQAQRAGGRRDEMAFSAAEVVMLAGASGVASGRFVQQHRDM